jgi:hypothetical protein
VVRDGNAVRIAREVVAHVGRAPTGRLGVHDPGLAIQGSDESAKGRIQLQRRQRAREIEAPRPKGIPEAGDELAAKEFPQDRDREEEAWTGMDPPGAARRQAGLITRTFWSFRRELSSFRRPSCGCRRAVRDCGHGSGRPLTRSCGYRKVCRACLRADQLCKTDGLAAAE